MEAVMKAVFGILSVESFILFLVALVVVCMNFSHLRQWLLARRAARRLGLRDRGKIRPFWEEGKLHAILCAQCGYSVRVGIKEGVTLQWCCVCEKTWGFRGGNDDDRGDKDQHKGGPPDGGEPIPEDIKQASQKLLDRIKSN